MSETRTDLLNTVASALSPECSSLAVLLSSPAPLLTRHRLLWKHPYPSVSQQAWLTVSTSLSTWNTESKQTHPTWFFSIDSTNTTCPYPPFTVIFSVSGIIGSIMLPQTWNPSLANLIIHLSLGDWVIDEQLTQAHVPFDPFCSLKKYTVKYSHLAWNTRRKKKGSTGVVAVILWQEAQK